MKRAFTTLAIGGLAASGLLLAATPAVAADQSEDLDRARARCLRGVENRLDRLDRAAERVGRAEHLTDDHEATLSDQLESTWASLEDLRGTIEDAADRDALADACKSVVQDHRVYVLVLPRTRLVVAADAELAAADRLTESADELETEIDQAEEAGADVSEQRTDLAAMRDYIDQARTAASGVPDQILDLEPSDWNHDHTVLDAAREDARDARGDLRSALRVAREITGDLRG